MADSFERHRAVLRAVVRRMLGSDDAFIGRDWDGTDPIGLAVFAVLESLAPAERLAFLLHDVFAMPCDEVAAIVGRSESATSELARGARARLQRL